MNEIILPRAPDNLEGLNEHESEIRANSLLYINSHPNLKDHLNLLVFSMDSIHVIITNYKHENMDELTVQYLGIRLFNDIASSIKLLLSGYYQSSLLVFRDVLETGYLLDYFTLRPNTIRVWRETKNKKRRNNFRPFKIREELDKRDNIKKSYRSKKYSQLSTYGAHPNPKGFKILANKGLGKIGPFFDEKKLRGTLKEFILNYPSLTLSFHLNFSNVGMDNNKKIIFYMDKIREWAKKYFKKDYSGKEIDELKTLLRVHSLNGV